MFERQAEGLEDIVGNDSQLKELYDSLECEDRKNQEEFELLKKQQNQVNSLLDSYGIPRTKNGLELTLFERIESALKQRMTA